MTTLNPSNCVTFWRKRVASAKRRVTSTKVNRLTVSQSQVNLPMVNRVNLPKVILAKVNRRVGLKVNSLGRQGLGFRPSVKRVGCRLDFPDMECRLITEIYIAISFVNNYDKQVIHVELNEYLKARKHQGNDTAYVNLG